jgi:hypothetical protein
VRIARSAKADAKLLSIDFERMVDDPIHRLFRNKRNLLGFELRDTHIGFVLVAFALKDVYAGDCPQLNLRLTPPSGFHQVGGRASQSVTRAFGFAAIAIEYPQVEGVTLLHPKDDAVCANAEIAVTNRLGKLAESAHGHCSLLDENKVVAESLSFYEIRHTSSM